MPSSNLGLPSIADGSTSFEQRVSDGFEQIDQATQGTLEHTDTASFVINTTEFTTYFRHNLTGAAGAGITVDVPASNRVFVVTNATGQNATIQVTGGGGANVVVATGTTQLLYCDGTDVIALAAAV